MMDQRLSYQELQDLPAGLRQVFAAFRRGESRARERDRATQAAQQRQ